MNKNQTRKQVAIALEATKAKKAEDIALLELPKQSSAFTDFFLICSGSNPRQVQAIADEIDERLSKSGVEPNHREGYEAAEWILLDYVDFVVHIFSSNSRRFYDLERLWKSATHLTEADLLKPAAKKAAKAAGKKTATRKTATRTKKPVGMKKAAPTKIAKKAAKKKVTSRKKK